MKQKLSILPNLALTAAITLALAFGVTQASANTWPCTLYISCIEEEPDPNLFCRDKCRDAEYPDGLCDPSYDCCICQEK